MLRQTAYSPDVDMSCQDVGKNTTYNSNHLTLSSISMKWQLVDGVIPFKLFYTPFHLIAIQDTDMENNPWNSMHNIRPLICLEVCHNFCNCAQHLDSLDKLMGSKRRGSKTRARG